MAHLRRRIFALKTVIAAKSAAALRSRRDCRFQRKKTRPFGLAFCGRLRQLPP
jgi:hypothetical protein